MGSTGNLHMMPEAKGRLYGKYRGIVVVGTDPEKQGRVKVTIPALYGTDVLQHWIYPVLPHKITGGLVEPENPKDWIVQEGAGVWIEFEGGSADKPLWNGFWKPGESKAGKG